MKKLIVVSIVLLSFLNSYSQKTNVVKGKYHKNKKIELSLSNGMEGLISISGNVILAIGESRSLIVSRSSLFHSIEENMDIGSSIRPKKVLFSGQMLKKRIYIEQFVEIDGTVYVFYSKKVKNKAIIYFTEFNEDCQINTSKGTEVMQLQLAKLMGQADFTVRKSFDGSKILCVGNSMISQKSASLIFKEYDKGMENLLWKKQYKAKVSNNWFSLATYDPVDISKNQNNMTNNKCLVRNDGRIFFLIDKENTTGTTVEYKIISIDPTGKNVTEGNVKISESKSYMGSSYFRLDNKGNANFIFFHSENADLLLFGTEAQSDINMLKIVSYDGLSMKDIYDKKLSNEQKSLFFPANKRKSKTNYNISGFGIDNIVDNEKGELAIIMSKNGPNVGSIVSLSNNNKYGFIATMVLDSAMNFKTVHSFIKGNQVSEHFDFYYDNNLNILSANENNEFQLVKFDQFETFKITKIKYKITDKNERVYFDKAIIVDDGVILPVTKWNPKKGGPSKYYCAIKIEIK